MNQHLRLFSRSQGERSIPAPIVNAVAQIFYYWKIGSEAGAGPLLKGEGEEITIKIRIKIGERGGHHSITAAPQVRPAPKTISKIRSPRWTRPEVTASSRAMATEAAEVLPY